MRYRFIFLIWMLGVALTSCSKELASTAIWTNEPDTDSILIERGILCPTTDEQARQYYNSAVDLAAAGQTEEAKHLYTLAIELDPSFCDAMDNLGQIYRSQGNVSEAIRWYERSLEIMPANPTAHQNLGVAYLLQGRVDEAITAYQTVTQLHPDDPEGYYGLGTIYAHIGSNEEAIKSFRTAEALYDQQSSPLAADARYALGVLYLELDEPAVARDCFDAIYAAEQGTPRGAYLNYLLGLCYLSREIEDLPLAEEYFRIAQRGGVDIPSELWVQVRCD